MSLIIVAVELPTACAPLTLKHLDHSSGNARTTDLSATTMNSTSLLPSPPKPVVLFVAAGRTIFLYDFLLTFADEVHYIWGSRPSLVKSLFLLCRYSIMIPMVLSIIGSSGFFNPSVRWCQVSFIFQTGWYGFIFGGWNWLLSIRVHAILSGSVNLWRILAISSIGLGAITTGLSLREGVAMSEGMTVKNHFCIPGKNVPAFYWINWVPVLIFNLALFAMAMSKLLHREYPSTGLRKLLIRDAIIYWSVLSTMQTVNLVLYMSNNQASTMFRFTYIYQGLGSNLVSRVVLNLRMYGDSTEVVDLDLDAVGTSTDEQPGTTESGEVQVVTSVGVYTTELDTLREGDTVSPTIATQDP
ncbi:hypothetical protein DL93DRAFT_2223286 [Clavulina sp. PMI_390]|nr:hypothetical protein DL93DRAFT_2223286 [Clavulina sp. PMI_390]